MKRPRIPGLLLLTALLALPAIARPQPQRPRLPKAERLDTLELRRNPVTGELTAPATKAEPEATPGTIRTRVNLVELGCTVVGSDGVPVRTLHRQDFRVYEDGAEQEIVHFDASSEPASIALVMDASPSEFRALDQMKEAARTFTQNLSPRDEVAVVAFARYTYLMLPFSSDRVLLERAIGSIRLLRASQESGSNIYQAVYLAAHRLFREPRRDGNKRTGRKAIVLLTDGQDSGLGLSWNPASALPRRGVEANRLTFEDVARELAALGVEIYVVSTENRPKGMTDAWLAASRRAGLVTAASRRLGMPHYTLYLAELVRRAGGHLYFLGETHAPAGPGRALSEVYRRIARTLSAQYTLGYYAAQGTSAPGWRTLEVRLSADAGARLPGAQLTYRVAYYVSAGP